MNSDNNELNCINNFFSHSYKSHISIPTRVTDQSSTCLDHIWANLNNLELSGVISNTNITDNFPSFVVFSFSSNEHENIVKASSDLSQNNINTFSDII